MWDNDAVIGDEIYIGSVWEGDSIPSTLTISYSDVEGGEASVYLEPDCTLNWLDGMIDEEPMFVLPDRRDYRLLWESPCIDAGHPGPQFYDPDETICDMGAHFFDQDDYLTLYVTPDKKWARPGGQFGVTYTVVNRWESPEPCWGISRVYFLGGGFFDLIGPDQFTVPANYTGQFHLTRNIPTTLQTGVYECWSMLFMPPVATYDEDGFTFWVIE
ncbi:MAG: hypothetical protein ACE5OP_11790 [Candidatus Glassbacteria bacterium]